MLDNLLYPRVHHRSTLIHQHGLVKQWETELLMDMALMYKNEQQTKILKELKKNCLY